MRFRITVRGLGIELRGTFDSDLGADGPTLEDLADAMKPFGVVIASVAESDEHKLPGDLAWDEYEREHGHHADARHGFAAGWNARRLFDLRQAEDKPLPSLDFVEPVGHDGPHHALHNHNVSRSVGYIPPGAH